jgi:hypothetical protein
MRVVNESTDELRFTNCTNPLALKPTSNPVITPIKRATIERVLRFSFDKLMKAQMISVDQKSPVLIPKETLYNRMLNPIIAIRRVKARCEER